jgi:hypothetical protein
LKIFVMNEKDQSWCECNASAKGYRGESQDHGHILQERQGSVLTNQCLGKERMNTERGAEDSFLPDGQRRTYSRETSEQYTMSTDMDNKRI